MRYLDRLLIPNERIVHLARRSVLVTFRHVLAVEAVLLIATAVGAIAARQLPSSTSSLSLIVLGSLLLQLVPLAMGAARYVWWRNKVYVVTDLRVLKLEGILSKAHRDAALDKINDLVLEQGIWARLLHFGNLQIQTANAESGVTYHYLSDPVEFKRQALQCREKLMSGTPAKDAAPEGDAIAQIARLGELREKGVITEEEFQAKKAALMKRIG